MKKQLIKAVCEIIQTACIVATTSAVIWFLWNIMPAFITYD